MVESEERRRFSRAISIFESALDLDVEERADFLRNACAGDVELQRIVQQQNIVW